MDHLRENELSGILDVSYHFISWTNSVYFGTSPAYSQLHKHFCYPVNKHANGGANSIPLKQAAGTDSRCKRASHNGIHIMAAKCALGRNLLYSIMPYCCYCYCYRRVVGQEEPRTINYSSVREWLHSLQLDEYTEHFHSAGYTTVHDLTDLSAADLEHVGVTSATHRRLLLYAIRETTDCSSVV